MRAYPFVTVTRKQEIRIRDGHPWIYGEEIVDQSGEIENGALVDVRGLKGQYLGTGIWSVTSKIRVRLLSDNSNETFGDSFFARRIRYALAYRKDVMGTDYDNCRLVHGEADGLPGVTIDRYGSILVAEILSFGMAQRKEILYKALIDAFQEDGTPLAGIYERNEGELRLKEGLAQEKGWVKMEGLSTTLPGRTVISENGIRYEVDFENGQKTGFFLDQKYNRLVVRKMAAGRRVLDCCTHTGAFALNAASGGAVSVTAVDISGTALEEASVNARMNDLNVRFQEADMFAFLENALQHHDPYDLIILDPPAFTKSRRTLGSAKMGYERLNTLAMRLLPRGGYLVTCSCSHFMSTENFKDMLHHAAREAGVSVRIVEERHAAPDHPVLMGVEETDYLKFFLLQIV